MYMGGQHKASMQEEQTEGFQNNFESGSIIEKCARDLQENISIVENCSAEPAALGAAPRES